MKYVYLFLFCFTLYVWPAERNEKRVLFTPYTISLVLNRQTHQEIQQQYKDSRAAILQKFTSGLRVSVLSTFGFAALAVARHYNFIDQNLAFYKAFPGFSLISLGACTFYYQKRKFWLNMPAYLNEQEIQDAFEEGKKNADKHIEKTCIQQ